MKPCMKREGMMINSKSAGALLAAVLPAALTALLTLLSCATPGAKNNDEKKQQAADDDSQQANAQNEQNEQDEIADDEGFLDDEPEKAVTYRHPRVATSRQTRFFVRSFLTKKNKPGLDNCQEYVGGMSVTASSRPEFLKNLRSLKDKIENQPLKYHHCFYYGLMTLDTQLARRRFGDDFEQVNTLFFARIRAAALLATGLGQHLDTKQYVDFLRSRYIEMSYSYFGRKVVPGDIRSPRQFPRSKGDIERSRGVKPAGEWRPDQ